MDKKKTRVALKPTFLSILLYHVLPNRCKISLLYFRLNSEYTKVAGRKYYHCGPLV